MCTGRKKSDFMQKNGAVTRKQQKKCEANGAKTFSEMFFFSIVSKYSKCSNAASLNFHQQQWR